MESSGLLQSVLNGIGHTAAHRTAGIDLVDGRIIQLLQAMQDTLHLEKCVNQSLLDLHKLATDSSDAHLCDFLETGYLDQQVKFIKELGDHVSKLSNVGSPEGSLAGYFSDKLTLGDGDKED